MDYTTLSPLSLFIFSILTLVPILNREPKLSQRLPLPGGASGPESLAFDSAGGGPYTGIADGRIIRWDANLNQWINFAITTPYRWGCEGSHDYVQTEARCGRPLGLRFDHKTGQLYIADADKGLLVVGANGGLATPIATQVQGIPFKFLNDLVFDHTSGIIYFTDSSTRFERKDYQSIILTGDNTGRLLKFDTKTSIVTVVLDKLMFPNGVELSKNGDFLLVAETTNNRVLRYWLTAPTANKTDVFTMLPGSPDNIRRNKKGDFWVAINGGQGYFSGLGMAARVDANGRIVEVIQDKYGQEWQYASEVDEENGYLWIGSVVTTSVVKLSKA